MDLEQKAFLRLREGELISKQYYDKPLLICYSGGKDSDVLLQLAINSGIDFEILHSHTTADAPETVYHIRDTFKRLEEQNNIKCNIEYPTYKGKRVTIWTLIPQKKMPPTRTMRYCCSVLKETGGKNRAISTGVRWSESRARNKRGIYEDKNNKTKRIILNNDNDDKRKWIERCEIKAKTIINPIIDWQEKDVWNYLKDNNTPYNKLYCEGYNRVGCIGCPMAGKKKRYSEFQKYPKFKQAYISTFERMINVRKNAGMGVNESWKTGEDVFRWWMGENPLQIKF